MKKLTKKSELIFVPLVGNGALASTGVGEGRMIPVLIVDCKEKVELRDLIYAHENSPPGDVTSTWGWPKWKKNRVFLILKFTKPAQIEVGITFDLKSHGALVDGIIHSNAFYLQPLEAGSNVMEGVGGRKIIVEIPDTDFLPTWYEIYDASLVKKFKASGLTSKEAKLASVQHREKMRNIWKRRMPA
ncbi:hypothetical protein [Endozoicomonas sp.]|uniref:hypothetical protein n=1 Tax=Endozoicomonas sp. TaxID=1892382 RepID=UPI00383B8A08